MKRGRKKQIEVEDLQEFLPHGCECSEEENSCHRCRDQRMRIRRLYKLDYGMEIAKVFEEVRDERLEASGD